MSPFANSDSPTYECCAVRPFMGFHELVFCHVVPLFHGHSTCIPALREVS